MELAAHALVVVDLQERIVALDTAPHGTDKVVARATALADAFRHSALPVVLVRTVNLERPDTEGDALVPALVKLEGTTVVTKHQWGAFHCTPLDLHLRRAGVRGIVLAGLMTNFGVESTARAAVELGYGIVLAEDATASVDAELHEFSVREIFSRLGATVTTTAALREQLDGRPTG